MAEPVKPRRSDEEIRRINELRRSAAAGRHDEREKRKRTRGDAERAAIDEQND